MFAEVHWIGGCTTDVREASRSGERTCGFADLGFRGLGAFAAWEARDPVNLKRFPPMLP